MLILPVPNPAAEMKQILQHQIFFIKKLLVFVKLGFKHKSTVKENPQLGYILIRI